MVRIAWFFPVALAIVVCGCIGEDAKNTLVPSEPFGSGLTGTRPAMSAQTVSRTSPVQSASTESAARVDQLGRNILAANPQIGMKPQFMVIGCPQPEVFHKQAEALYVTDGLVKQCKTDGELAAVLCHELAKMVSDREVQMGPQVWNPRRQPPPEVCIGTEGPGGSISADRTRLAELATFEQERRQEAGRSARPLDPKVLAPLYLQKAGFTEADWKAAQPRLQAAAANLNFEKQMVKPPASAWAN